jgi:hypothetical protein
MSELETNNQELNETEVKSTESTVVLPITVIDPPRVEMSVEIAATLYAMGYIDEAHKSALRSFCRSTGFPSHGSIPMMINTLRAYGYAIKPGV